MRQTVIVLLMCATASGCARDEATSPDASAPQASAVAPSPDAPLEPVALDVGKTQPAFIKADIDCDGVEDAARMEYVEDRVRVTVTLAATQTSESLEFGLGDSMAQESLCGTEATLEIEDMDYDLIEALGENPEGFRESKTCKGLRLADQNCDSMHLFWNHETKHIDWVAALKRIRPPSLVRPRPASTPYPSVLLHRIDLLQIDIHRPAPR